MTTQDDIECECCGRFVPCWVWTQEGGLCHGQEFTVCNSCKVIGFNPGFHDDNKQTGRLTRAFDHWVDFLRSKL